MSCELLNRFQRWKRPLRAWEPPLDGRGSDCELATWRVCLRRALAWITDVRLGHISAMERVSLSRGLRYFDFRRNLISLLSATERRES